MVFCQGRTRLLQVEIVSQIYARDDASPLPGMETVDLAGDGAHTTGWGTPDTEERDDAHVQDQPPGWRIAAKPIVHYSRYPGSARSIQAGAHAQRAENGAVMLAVEQFGRGRTDNRGETIPNTPCEACK